MTTQEEKVAELTTNMDTENRDAWYKIGEQGELDFIKTYGKGLRLAINPDKETDKTVPDLLCLKTGLLADLKKLSTPYYMSQKQHGIPPEFCFTFNHTDFIEYCVLHPNDFLIIVWQTFERSMSFNIMVEQEEAVYYVSLLEMKELVKKSGKLHYYNRRENDDKGNAKSSYPFDLRDFNKVNNLHKYSSI